MSKTIRIKWPSITPGHPAASPGWLSHRAGRAILAVEDIPDDIDLPSVILRISNTTLLIPTEADAPPEAFVFTWADLRPGPGQILNLRKRADLHDEIQETCIARAEALGLTAYAIAQATVGEVSEDHVRNYLTRRASMGSHKLQHVLRVLRVRLAHE